MKCKYAQDYDTYREVMSELLSPISANGLDDETLYRLYKSKQVYLENLRSKCFKAMNSEVDTLFTTDDYAHILRAIDENRAHLRSAILLAINTNLSRRKAV